MGYQAKTPLDVEIIFYDIKMTFLPGQNRELKNTIKAIKNKEININYLGTLKQELEVLSEDEIYRFNTQQLDFLCALSDAYPTDFFNMIMSIRVGQQMKSIRKLTDLGDNDLNVKTKKAARELVKVFNKSISITHGSLLNNKTQVQSKKIRRANNTKATYPEINF